MDVGPAGGAGAVAQAANLAKPQQNTQPQPAVREVPLADEPRAASEDDRVGSQLDVTA